jgi:hypothetical protein
MTIDPNSPVHRRRLIGWRPTTGPPSGNRPDFKAVSVHAPGA